MMTDLQQKSVVDYIERLWDTDSYRFSVYSEPSTLPTSFSVMSLHALAARDKLAARKDGLIDYFVKNISNNGLIVDSRYTPASRKHDAEYLQFQTTYFSLIALDVLGKRIDKLPFLEKFFHENFFNEWVSTRFKGNFWAESNKLMFLFYFLAYAYDNGSDSERLQISDLINKYFDIIESFQDKETGFWGGGKSLHRKAYGAAHLYLYYDFFGRDIPYKEKIVDHTLKLHASNGLAETRHGGACEDYNLIEIYLRISKQTDYRKADIERRMVKLKKTIQQKSDVSGGFSYSFFGFSNLLNRLFALKPPIDRTYSYSSQECMTTPIYYPDCWATFFRTLSLNAIDYMFGDTDIPTYWLPGWGYIFDKKASAR